MLGFCMNPSQNRDFSILHAPLYIKAPEKRHLIFLGTSRILPETGVRPLQGITGLWRVHPS